MERLLRLLRCCLVLFCLDLVDTTQLKPFSQRSRCARCQTSHQVIKRYDGCKVGPIFFCPVLWEFGFWLLWIKWLGVETRVNIAVSRLRGIVRKSSRSCIGRCISRHVNRWGYHHHNVKEQPQRSNNLAVKFYSNLSWEECLQIWWQVLLLRCESSCTYHCF